jgi:hypothetical protein
MQIYHYLLVYAQLFRSSTVLPRPLSKNSSRMESLQRWDTSMTSGYPLRPRRSASAHIIALSNCCLTSDSSLTGINASRQRHA